MNMSGYLIHISNHSLNISILFGLIFQGQNDIGFLTGCPISTGQHFYISFTDSDFLPDKSFDKEPLCNIKGD